MPAKSLISNEQMIAELQRVAAELGQDYVTRTQFGLQSKLCPASLIERRFGTWNAATEAASLKPTAQAEVMRGKRVSDDDLLRNLLDIYRQVGRVPTVNDVERFGAYSIGPYRTRGMDLTQATAEAVTRFGGEAAAAEVGAILQTRARRPERARERYGELIDFRGFRYAPTNETGVVGLFTTVCQELGFVIEIIRNAHPDCQAVRRTAQGDWVPVAIEFELCSSNYRDHGHDDSECDLIVCWEDNWPDCPLEVIELKSVIRKLPSPTSLR